MAVSRTTRWFLFCEISCFFLFSIWWRKDIPLWLGVGIGGLHLAALVVMLRLWERWRYFCELGERRSEQPVFTGGGLPALVILVIATGIQMMFLKDPVLSGPDEVIMLTDHIVQVSLFTSMHWLLQAGFIVCCIGLWLSSVALCRPPADGATGVRAWVTEIVRKRWLIAGLVLLVAGYGWLEQSAPFLWGLAERWPPFGTVLSMPLQIVMADKILAVRLTSLIFYVGVGYLVYAIACRELGQWPAAAVLLLVMLAPAFFVYGHYGFREMGGVFLFTLSMYFLHALSRTNNIDCYGLAIASATLGYLQRRPTILALLVVAIVLLWIYRLRVFRIANLRLLLLPVACAIWIVLPWYLISSNVRPYVPQPAKLLELATVTGYPAALPALIGWPFTLLCVCGLAAGIFFRRRLTLILVLWLVLFNLLFAMDITAPQIIQRFFIQFLPPLGLLAGLSFLWFRNVGGAGRLALVERSVSLAVAGLAVATLLTWAVDDSRRVPVLPPDGVRYVSQPLYPYEQLVRSLQAWDQPVVLYQPAPWQSALPIYLKTSRPQDVSLKQASWQLLGQDLSLATAIVHCRQAGCTHLVEPVKRTGEFLFHEGEFIADANALLDIVDVQVFSNRHGKVAMLELGE